MKFWTMAAATAVVAVIGAAGLSLAFAPALYSYAFPILPKLGLQATPPPLIAGAPAPGPALGAVVDGYWRVQKIAPDTYAIGEPQNDPDNYEYLLIGKTRALLIDSGSTLRDIHPVLKTLTALPVTVIPSHLHFDHTNGLRYFSDIALIDLPETRARVRDGEVHLSHDEYLGPAAQSPVFKVSEWVKPDSVIDLGGRRVQVLWTPGHTTNSISIHDPAAKLLFTGDMIYTTSLYAFQPDSSLASYAATTKRLLNTLPADTVIYGAHCCRNDVPAQAPWLTMTDLRDVQRAVTAIQTGKAKGTGFILRRFPVNAQMTLITFYPFGNR